MFGPSNSPATQSDSDHHPLSRLVSSIFSYNSNVMLAALVSLLLVIVFVLLLHVYAKWFLAHAHHRRRTSSETVSRVLGPTRFHNFPSFRLDDAAHSSSPTKGLDATIISAIPLFVYKVAAGDDPSKLGPECVICLSGFDDGDVGRNLPKCGHAFHLECIDMWLGSHSTCPICRAPAMATVVADGKLGAVGSADGDGGSTETPPAPSDSIAVDVSGSGEAENIATYNDCTSLPASSSSFGSSLKRMLSRNRSENKVFPASSVNELAA